jgi:hypothetical protein
MNILLLLSISHLLCYGGGAQMISGISIVAIIIGFPTSFPRNYSDHHHYSIDWVWDSSKLKIRWRRLLEFMYSVRLEPLVCHNFWVQFEVTLGNNETEQDCGERKYVKAKSPSSVIFRNLQVNCISLYHPMDEKLRPREWECGHLGLAQCSSISMALSHPPTEHPVDHQHSGAAHSANEMSWSLW